MGGGGNGIYLATFNFVFLFENKAFRTTLFTAAFGAVGYWYILLSIDSIPSSLFFLIYGIYAFVVGVLIIFAFPPTAYGMDSDGATICLPCVKSTCVAFPVTPFYRCFEGLKELRFWAFLICFSWLANLLAWSQGALLQRYSDASPIYKNLGYPLISNAVFLVNPFIGKLIDKSGFVIPAALNIVIAELLLVCLYFDNVVAQWSTLLFMMLLSAFNYSIEFAYITLAFPAEMFPGLLFVCVLGQFSVGFLAIFLGTSMPWGYHWNYYVIFLLAPTVIMYIFPILQWKEGGGLLQMIRPRRMSIRSTRVVGFVQALSSGIRRNSLNFFGR